MNYSRRFLPRILMGALPPYVFTISLILGLLLVAGLPFGGSRVYAQEDASHKIWLQDPHALPVTFGSPAIGAPTRVASAFATGQVQPLALANGRFYEEDGIEGLAVGYATSSGGAVAIYRGNLDAFAPQSEESFLAIGQGRFPSPFLPNARLFELPERPDFLATGNFTGGDHLDIVAAAKNSSALYILANDGNGNFTAYPAFTVPGVVTALATTKFNQQQISEDIVVAVDRPAGPALLVYSTSANGFYLIGAYPLQAPATALAVGNLDGDANPDVAVIAGGNLFILHGRNLTPAGSLTQGLEAVPLPFSPVAIVLGSFIFDRDSRVQMALLGSDGSLNFVVRNGFDPTPWTLEEIRARRQRIRNGEPDPYVEQQSMYRPDTWRVIENVPAVASSGNANQNPALMSMHISDRGADDVMVLDSAAGRMTVIAHQFHSIEDNTLLTGAFPAAERISRAYTPSSTVNALPMRVNVDGRPGVLSIHQGQLAPSAMMPIPDPAFFPNRFDDIAPRGTAVTCLNTTGVDASNDCTLREALIKANATAGTDDIHLQAGTYQLSLPKVPGDFTSAHGALYVNDSVNILGAGQNSTIIQAGTTNANGVDMVMAVNEDINPITNATASISNLTLKFGRNTGTHGNDGDGGCMEFDTGSSGLANLTLTNVTLTDCSTTFGNGAGIAIFNFTAPNNGLATFTNSIIQNNSAVDATANVGAGGGGIWVSQDSRASLTNTQVLNNKATQVNGTGKGIGGGIFTFTNTPNSRQTVIHSSTISGNKSAGFGGGIFNSVNLLVDQGTVISGNTAGTDGTNPIAGQLGGGLYDNTSSNGCPGACTDTATLTKVTITGNTASASGGGIYQGNNTGGGSLTMSFSRLAGNTATSGSNLFEDHSVATATNNWWGTNAPSTTITNTAGTVTFDPFIVLTHNGNPQKIRINQSSTLTGDMSKDNHGNGAALSGNLNQIVGLPITFDNATLGTIPQAQPETLANPVPTATATFNAGGTSGFGTANATVDQAVVPVNSNLIASATESGSTATITTVGAHGYSNGEFVKISGVGVAGYNGNPGQFFTITVTGPTTFTYTANASGLAPSSGGTANAGIIILQPPSITKGFSPNPVAVNAASTITFSITNGNVVPIDSSFTDNLPAGMVVATPPNVVNNCGGSVTATAATGTISFANAALPVGTCTVNVNVQASPDQIYSNSVTINSTDAGNGNTSSANLTVINPPHSVKTFGAASIPLNGTTSLTITLSSTNVNLTLNGITFTDSLPAGLVVANPNNLTDTCSGAATAVSGSSSVSLATSSLAPGASCTVSVNVTGTTAGTKSNSVTASDTTAGTGNTATASLDVIAPPTISKAFNPAVSIPLNGTTTLTFTISNPNLTALGDLTGVAFSDTLPSTTGTLVVAPTPNVSNTCNGTVTATAGTGVISLSGGSVAHNASCTLSVDVKGTAAGDAVNTTGAITSTQGGTGTTSNTATIKIVAPPTISKAFGAASIPLNGTTTVTFTITNPAANTTAENGIAFSDTLTNGLQVASTPGVSNTCGGTVTATANTTTISLSGGSIATPGTTCTIVVNVTGTATGTVTNTTGAVSSTNGGTGATSNTATLIVASPATVTKTFAPTKIQLNGTTLLTINITNPNSNVSLTGLSFTDSLPAGLVVASVPNLNNTCGGTATATAGSGSVSLSGGTVASSASCAVSVNVQGTTAGDKSNSVQVSSTEGGASTTASATVTVVAPPTISKAFNPTSIPLNGTSTVTFTISNPNNPGTPANGDLTGVAFSDTLPVSGGPGSATLVVSNTPNVSNTCGGTVTATAGSGVISLSGASVAHNTSCTLSVDVKGTVQGDANNTTAAISSTEGGTGTTSNTALLKVVAPPTISKAFGAANITLNGTTTVTFTITDPASNTSAENGIAFSDTLTNGLQVASTPGVSNTCGGTVTAAANSTSISLVGGSIATPGTSCTIVVNVTGTQSGTVSNTTGAVSSTNGGTGATSNTATLVVASPPSISKSFNPTTIAVNANSTLTFNITNPNTNVTLTGLAFTDNLPAGLVVATPNGLSNTCGGTATATAGSGAVSLSGGTLAANASCTVVVNVTGTTGGVKSNSVTITSTEGGTGNTSSANLTVIGPPTISKAFGAASIPLNGTTSVSFTIANPNTVALTGIGFNDTLPAGLVIATPNGLAGTCLTVAGSVTNAGVVTATQGTSVISMSSLGLAASGSCTLSVNVTGTTAGSKSNTTGAITSTEGGTGTTSNTAVLNVVAPPSIAKAFNPTGIPVNGTSTLTITITNPAANAVAENGVAFTDNLPTNLVVATPNGLANTCGGTATAIAGTGTVSLTGGSIATNSSCTVSVNVTSAVGGTYTNTTGNVSSTNGGTGNTASATLSVAAPPTITKAFFASAVALNGTVSVGFDLSNPNASVDLTGVAFTDNLPAGLVVATPNGLSNNCGGTVTATAGSSSIALTGASLPAANPTCSIFVNLRATTLGVKNNTTGPISSNESGPGAASNTATLEVIGPPTVTKAFGAATIPLNGTTSLTFTFTNSTQTVTFVNVALSDTLPGGLVVANPSGVGGTCVTNNGAAVTANPGSNNIGISAFNMPSNSNCTLIVNVTGVTAGVKNNTSGNVMATFDDGSGTFVGINGGTASASIIVVAPPVIAKAFNPMVIPRLFVTSLTFTISNPNPTVALIGVAFTDTLPTGLSLVNSGSSAQCGGTLTTTVPTSIALTGATINANSQCQFSLFVTGLTLGNYTNVTGNVTSTNGGTGNTAAASLSVGAVDLAITKSHVGNFFQGQNGTYTIAVSNIGTTPTLGLVTVTDALPASLTATAMTGTGWTCTLSPLACTRSDALANGASYPAITLTVNVSATAPASVTNTATVAFPGDVNPANNTANDATTISPPPFLTITPGISSATVKRGQAATFTFTVNASVPGTIAQLCSGLPAGASCSFNPLSPSSNGSTPVTLLISTTGPPGLAMLAPQQVPFSRGPVYVAMTMTLPTFGLLFLGLKRGRRNKGKLAGLIVLGVLLLIAMLALAGCGGNAKGFGEDNHPTPPGTYQITVTETNGTTTAQTTVTLTVTP